MRLGPILAATALAALTAGCNRSQPTATANPPAVATPALSEEEKHEALEHLPAPYKTADIANGEAKFALCQSCHTLASART